MKQYDRFTIEEKIEEMTLEIKQKVKDETFFGALDSFTPEQQGAIKRYLMMKEEEREKQQRGDGILTSYAHIIYGKWNKISGFGRILNG